MRQFSGFIINQAMGRATASVYTQRFGSLSRAYQLVGFGNADRLEFMELNRRLRRHSAEVRVLSAEADNQRKHRRHLHSLSTQHSVLSTVKTVLARCHTLVDKYGQSRQRWRIRFDPARLFATGYPDLTLAIRLDAANTSELDYYLLPRLDLPEQEIRVSNRNSASFECFRFDNLNFFYGMAKSVLRTEDSVLRKSPNAAIRFTQSSVLRPQH